MKRILGAILAVMMLLSGIALAEETWVCPDCGKTNDNRFCTECGKEKPEAKSENAGTGMVEIGDTLSFGHYAQTASRTDSTPIEWIVLAKEGNAALLISKYALDSRAYNETNEETSWDACSLRSWLNGEFFNSAFSSEEQASICTTALEPDANPDFDTPTGDRTNDRVFILSASEARKYFSSDEARVGEPTDYALASDKNASGWWLRTPAALAAGAAYVKADGGIYYLGHACFFTNICVRPALWINLGQQSSQQSGGSGSIREETGIEPVAITADNWSLYFTVSREIVDHSLLLDEEASLYCMQIVYRMKLKDCWKEYLDTTKQSTVQMDVTYRSCFGLFEVDFANLLFREPDSFSVISCKSCSVTYSSVSDRGASSQYAEEEPDVISACTLMSAEGPISSAIGEIAKDIEVTAASGILYLKAS